MHNSKLIQLLKSLEQSEIREFKDFISSPVYNKNKKIILLFDTLKNFYPDFNHSGLSNERIFEKTFKGEKYDYFKLKNLTSDLFGLGKEYLSFVNVKKSVRLKDRHLLAELRSRNLDKLFEQSFKKAEQKLLKEKILDENYFFRKLELTEEKLFYNIPKNPDSRFEYFQDELDYFLKHALIRLLKFYNIMQLEKAQTDYNLNLWLYDEVMNYIKDKEDEDNPTLLIYYYILLLTKERDEKYFFRLKKLKSQYFDNLDPESRYTLFLHMHNFCAYNFNVKCNTDFLAEQFLLTKDNYESKSLFLGKVLYPDFLNHVKIAARVDEFEWAENFINEFSHLLTEEKDSTLNFCYGYINYKKRNFEEAMEYLSKTNFPIFIMKVQVKILLLQINYEKGYYEQALSLIDSFRHYLSRNSSIPEESKEFYYSFIRIMNDLIKVSSGIEKEGNEFRIEKLKNNTESIIFNLFEVKIWLKEKIKKLN